MPIDPYARAQAAQDLARRRRARRAAVRPRPPAVRGDPDPAGGSPSQRRGHAAETLAARHLAGCGLRILAHNLRCRAGEIDLVARHGPTLVFVEVRQRSGRRHGGAAASVNRDKQARLTLAAAFFLPRIVRVHFQGRPPPCRFDVVALDGRRIEWIRAAFGT